MLMLLIALKRHYSEFYLIENFFDCQVSKECSKAKADPREGARWRNRSQILATTQIFCLKTTEVNDAFQLKQHLRPQHLAKSPPLPKDWHHSSFTFSHISFHFKSILKVGIYSSIKLTLIQTNDLQTQYIQNRK